MPKYYVNAAVDALCKFVKPPFFPPTFRVHKLIAKQNIGGTPSFLTHSPTRPFFRPFLRFLCISLTPKSDPLFFLCFLPLPRTQSHYVSTRVLLTFSAPLTHQQPHLPQQGAAHVLEAQIPFLPRLRRTQGIDRSTELLLPRPAAGVYASSSHTTAFHRPFQQTAMPLHFPFPFGHSPATLSSPSSS